MPVKKEREYRTLVAPLAAQNSGEKRLQSECYVEATLLHLMRHTFYMSLRTAQRFTKE